MIDGGVLMRVSPNFVANRWINLYFKFFENFSDSTFERHFVRFDRTAGEIPHIRKWDRNAATIVTQLHEDTTIGPLQKHRGGDAFAHARLALVLEGSFHSRLN
jgi:hypothetical protein